MSDGETVVFETLWSLVGERVRIDSSLWPGVPAIGKLLDVGPDDWIGAICAHVQVRRHVRRFVPVKNVVYVGKLP